MRTSTLGRSPYTKQAGWQQQLARLASRHTGDAVGFGAGYTASAATGGNTYQNLVWGLGGLAAGRAPQIQGAATKALQKYAYTTPKTAGMGKKILGSMLSRDGLLNAERNLPAIISGIVGGTTGAISADEDRLASGLVGGLAGFGLSKGVGAIGRGVTREIGSAVRGAIQPATTTKPSWWNPIKRITHNTRSSAAQGADAAINAAGRILSSRAQYLALPTAALTGSYLGNELFSPNYDKFQYQQQKVLSRELLNLVKEKTKEHQAAADLKSAITDKVIAANLEKEAGVVGNMVGAWNRGVQNVMANRHVRNISNAAQETAASTNPMILTSPSQYITSFALNSAGKYIPQEYTKTRAALDVVDKLAALRSSIEKRASANYRPRGTLFLTDGKGNIMAGKASDTLGSEATSPYYFPGGGIFEEEGVDRVPTPEEIEEGMRREALEELGYSIKNYRSLGEPTNLDMPEWWKERQRRKRGVEYKGLAEYYGTAEAGDRDMSLYDVEGDAFKGGWEPIDTVAAALEDVDPSFDYGPSNHAQAKLLRALQQKTAKDNHVEQRRKERAPHLSKKKSWS